MTNTPESYLILYQTEDGLTKVEVRLLDETVWLNQAQLSKLFDKDKRTISKHIKNIFNEGELQEDSVVLNFRITAADVRTTRLFTIILMLSSLLDTELLAYRHPVSH
jgi:hypothetical protein